MKDLMIYTLVPLFWISVFLVYRHWWLKRKFYEVCVAEAVLALYEVEYEYDVYQEKGDFDVRMNKYPSLPRMMLMFWKWDWYSARKL